MDNSDILREMNISIQQEQADIKAESILLSERKKILKKKEAEYLRLTLEALNNQEWKKVSVPSIH